MAKSMRSKWKRKMNAIKRVRYGIKELAKLKQLVENATDVSEPNENVKEETPVTPITISHKPRGRERSRRRNGIIEETEVQSEEAEKMEVTVKPKIYVNHKDENGHYPIWMHPRQMRRLKNAIKIHSKQSKRRLIRSHRKKK